MIEIINVTKRFHTLRALHNVTLAIPQGEVLGVLGPNGAGKTTLFKLIAGFLTPDAGRVQATTPGWPAIGFKPERLLFPNQMRVRQYLELVAGLCNLSKAEARQAVEENLARVHLTEAAHKRITECSKGMRQRLGLAQALIGDPPLLLLDEPSNGLDPEGQADICRHIQALHHAGKTIVLASHQLHEVTQVCTRLVILNQGTVHYENLMSAALAERPHATIQADKDITPLAAVLQSLHPEIQVNGPQVVLNNEAMRLRRHVLSILVGGGFDILRVEQSRVTLAEIYAQAIQ
ncbi:MAG: ABC transporter ATP-binding protein [Chloroflexi bacterium]|nr:ABC transporter ATP-binding protein [Chloroflexota bacterium]MCI0580075.1 ABC transporter ATP-binding protein [Chloroflexota bacterium]MCI0643497.1 ABC transporter ATP-binding protein [Chloroflexota bacterium]MCI0728265.1 ABC transporter ATP-binding protein [Chloroflexota bacterium]